MKIMFIVLVLTVTLGGCATPNISNDFDVSQAERSGVVSGTITYQGVYGGYTIHVSSIDGKSRYRLAHGTSQIINPLDAFVDEAIDPLLGKMGSAFVVEMPAGEYRIYGWQIGVGAMDVYSSSAIDIRFKVEPKKAIYLGNFDFVVTETFMNNPSRAQVTLSDQYERDLEVIRNTAPSLTDVQVTRAFEGPMDNNQIGGQGNAKLTIMY
jgi:hypothetical protein